MIAGSISRDGREAPATAEPAGFDLPPALVARYEVRIVDGVDGEQRIGLFRPADREPSIEITDARIVARSEDAETVAALVEIARASGWDRIAVDGSPDFRRAVWEAGTRQGLAVGGYEPGFDEQARVEQARIETAARREREVAGSPTPAAEATISISRAEPAQRQDAGFKGPGPDGVDQGLSDADRRLLLTLSRHTEDRKGIAQGMRPDMDAFEREVQYERLDTNREALTAALERALESPPLAKAFERSGYDAGTLRDFAKGGRWDDEVADAIYLVRSGRHRDTLDRHAFGDRLDVYRDNPVLRDAADPARGLAAARDPAPDQPLLNAASERRRESDELAELFLHGTGDRVASEPRLARALQAQAVMERHIGEVFDGDPDRMATASLDSRRMISDALRGGLEVTVREPVPVRQIEPAHTRPDMER